MILFLIGYMACGKTTLGHALAKASLARFVDLDEYIERRTGLSAAAWFSRHGEEAFRDAEHRLLTELIEESATEAENTLPLAVGCGGGTPCRAESMELMLRHGTVVWLKASIERTIERIALEPGKRPLLAGLTGSRLREFVVDHFQKRCQAYSEANLVFDSSRLDTPAEIDATVDEFNRKILSTLGSGSLA